MAVKPARLPVWATIVNNPDTLQPTKVEPPADKKALGWVYQEKPPHEYMNDWMNLVYSWAVYLDELTAAQVPFDPTGTGMAATNVQAALVELDARLDIEEGALDNPTAAQVPVTPVGDLNSNNVQAALEEHQTDIDLLEGNLAAHLAAPTDAHDAAAVSLAPVMGLVADDVQAGVEELAGNQGAIQTTLTNHITGLSAHDAAAVDVTPAGNLGSANVQAALEELQGDADTALAHITNPADAHDAAAISYDPTASGLAATDAQAALDELAARPAVEVLVDETPSVGAGWTGGGNDYEYYQPGAGDFYQLWAFQYGQHRAESVILGNDLYTVGLNGASGGGAGTTAYLWRFNIQTRTWTRLSVVGTGLTGFRAFMAAVDGKVYILGGYASTAIHVYDPATGVLSTRSAVLYTEGISSGASVVIGQKIHCIGGLTDADVALTTVRIYDTVTDTVAAGTAIPAARGGLAAVVFAGDIYTFGGADAAGNATTTVYKQTGGAGAWATLGAMPASARRVHACVLEGKVYAYGMASGGDAGGQFFRGYTPGTDTWDGANLAYTNFTAFGATNPYADSLLAWNGQMITLGWSADFPTDRARVGFYALLRFTKTIVRARPGIVSIVQNLAGATVQVLKGTTPAATVLLYRDGDVAGVKSVTLNITATVAGNLCIVG